MTEAPLRYYAKQIKRRESVCSTFIVRGFVMESIEMIKCFLKRDVEHPGYVRYIPLEIYELWRFLMERVHGLAVTYPQISKWVPSEEGVHDAPSGTEVVIEIKFKYMQVPGTRKPVIRYFPEKDFDGIYGYFKTHFPDDSKMEGISKRKGSYYVAEETPYKAGE